MPKTYVSSGVLLVDRAPFDFGYSSVGHFLQILFMAVSNPFFEKKRPALDPKAYKRVKSYQKQAEIMKKG